MPATLTRPPKKAKKRPESRKKQAILRKRARAAAELEKELIDFSPEEVQAEQCRQSFYEFVKAFWDVVVREKAVWNWHIEFLCDELQGMAERVFLGLPKEHDLVVNISPGTTKSTIFSIMFPVWVWTRLPSARVATICYAFTLAVGFARKSRDIVQSDPFKKLFPEIVIRSDQNAKHNYETTLGGERLASGIDGMILGKHFHFLIVDDPISPKDANSDVMIASTNLWMNETLPSRTVDKDMTPIIIVMQRLAENDPTGDRLEQAETMPVRHICLPAELNDDVQPEYAREFYVDGLMDPVRLSHKALTKAEAKGDFYYSSQFLQSPIPRGTATFITRLLHIEKPPTVFKRIVRFWDKACSLNGGAFTVGTKMGLDEQGRFWVLDVIRVQLDSGRREMLIRSTARTDGKKVRIGVEREPGSGGEHSALSTISGLAGFRAIAVRVGKSDGDKEARADPFSSQVNVGNVSLAPGPWNREYLNELRFFPRSKYKDQVDSSAGAFNMLATNVIRVGGGSLLSQAV